MKRFKFRLDKVLDFRKVVKNDRLRELMDRTRELGIEEDKLADLERMQAENALPSGVVSIEELTYRGAFSERLKREIPLQRQRIVEFQKRVDEAMEVYVEAMKDEKTLVTLREKRLKEYQEYAAKEEDKLLDELSIQRMGRKEVE